MTAYTAALTDPLEIEDEFTFSTEPLPVELYSVLKSGGHQVWDPSFSPDGTTVIFAERTNTLYKISTISIGATGSHDILISGANPYADPYYSLDGLFILFSEQISPPSGPMPYGQWALKYMNADGTGVVTILNDGNANVHPCWVTPNQIAFQYWGNGATASSTFQIALVDLAGGGRIEFGEGEYPRAVII